MSGVATPRVVVAGTASGVGKTTVAIGLMAAFAARGRSVAGFKVGPDFIDPGYHRVATHRPARNLDPFLCGEERIGPLFAHGLGAVPGGRPADLAVVEGVMGLFDGRRGTAGFASTAHVARLLRAPVLLVVDAASMADSVAALVHGYASFDPAVRVAGVVLNRVGSTSHAALLREALAPLQIPVLGVIGRAPRVTAPSRHLGLVPVAERPAEAARAVAETGELVAAGVDLDAVARLAASAPWLDVSAWSPAQAGAAPPTPHQGAGAARVAVAGGPAFSFLYAENVELLVAAGAELLAFDPTRDDALPPGTTAIYLGGGFPEAHASALSANGRLRSQVAAFAAAGGPILAECGGLLYLCESLDDQPLCGVLPARATMGSRLQLGYRTAVPASASTFFPREPALAYHGHEFHHSRVTPDSGGSPAWTFDASGVADASVAAGRRAEGFVHRNVHASYLHTHWAGSPGVARRLVAAAAEAAVAA